MDLRCSNRVLWGLGVRVNQSDYPIGAEGECLGVSEVDARALMQNATWALIDGSRPKPVEPVGPKAELMAQGTRALIEKARSMNISVMGKDSGQVAEEILAMNLSEQPNHVESIAKAQDESAPSARRKKKG